MEIRHKELDGVLVLSLVGKMVIGDGGVLFRDEVIDIVEKSAGRPSKILLDLSGVKNMDSSGLGELIRGQDTLLQASILVGLFAPKGKARNVLDMTQLIDIFRDFTCHETVEKAAEEFWLTA